jgi:peptidoglycan/xylan/chitin deacetylase (PgdA/CDA1 family)
MLIFNFDDGNVCQLKWARALNANGIKATFFVNGSTISDGEHLNVEHLKRIQDEFGHTIGNHIWEHKCPKHKLTVDQLYQMALINAEWLTSHGFIGGEKLVALPYGHVGGGWSQASIEKMLEFADQIRDVESDGNSNIVPPQTWLASVCDNLDYSLDNVQVAHKTGRVHCIVMHNDVLTPDPHFLRYLDRVVELRDNDGLKIVNNSDLILGVTSGR